MKIEKGKLIAFEGMDGVGKTTIAYALNDWLNSMGKRCIVTSAISKDSTEYGKRIGDILRDKNIEGPIDPLAEAMLIAAARRDNWKRVIEPAIDAGIWVITDRHVDSIFAYQREADWGDVLSILITAKIRKDADLTFFMDIKPDSKRIFHDKDNRLEARDMEWWKECRRAFLYRVYCDSGKVRDEYCVIDGEESIFDIYTKVTSEVFDRFMKKARR